MTDKRYYTILAILSAMLWLAGAANIFIGAATIDRITAGIGFALAISAGILSRFCAVKLKVIQ